MSLCAPGRYSPWIQSQRVTLGLQSVSGKLLQGEKHTRMQNNTEEWGTTPVLEGCRRNILLVLRCRNNAFPGSCSYKSLNSQVSTFTTHKDTLQHAPQGWHSSVQSQLAPELTEKILWRLSQVYICPHTAEHFPSTEVVYILHLSQGCRLSPRGCDPAASQWVCPYRTSG